MLVHSIILPTCSVVFCVGIEARSTSAGQHDQEFGRGKACANGSVTQVPPRVARPRASHRVRLPPAWRTADHPTPRRRAGRRRRPPATYRRRLSRQSCGCQTRRCGFNWTTTSTSYAWRTRGVDGGLRWRGLIVFASGNPERRHPKSNVGEPRRRSRAFRSMPSVLMLMFKQNRIL